MMTTIKIEHKHPHLKKIWQPFAFSYYITHLLLIKVFVYNIQKMKLMKGFS